VGKTLGEFRRASRKFKGKAELFEMRHLAVGKEAADIEGPDQNGVRFKLSDYRGKVVLLYFWQHV
jgi:cytochrome oxidase Cu insertion factor (SCO1/SenC/PrrC family)